MAKRFSAAFTLVAGIGLAAALSACGSKPASTAGAAQAAKAEAPQTFRCDNGQAVQVQFGGNDQVALQLGEQRVQLVRDVSGSGERYTSAQGLNGQATAWHQKGRNAVLDYTGADGKPAEARCQAE